MAGIHLNQRTTFHPETGGQNHPLVGKPVQGPSYTELAPSTLSLPTEVSTGYSLNADRTV